jgi:hypothetical protein
MIEMWQTWERTYRGLAEKPARRDHMEDLGANEMAI